MFVPSTRVGGIVGAAVTAPRGLSGPVGVGSSTDPARAGAVEDSVELSPEAARRLMTALQAEDPLSDLTEREHEGLIALSKGLSNQDIAEQLSVTEKTVKTHVSNVLSKLNVKSRTQAAVYAWQTGLVKPARPA